MGFISCPNNIQQPKLASRILGSEDKKLHLEYSQTRDGFPPGCVYTTMAFHNKKFSHRNDSASCTC